MINLVNDERPVIQVPCNISKKQEINKYIFHCEANETFKGELHSAVSFIDDNDILLLIFDEVNESIVNVETTQKYRRFYIRNDNTGAMIGITISITATIALIIFIIFYLNKKNKKNKRAINDFESSIRRIKTSDDIKY